MGVSTSVQKPHQPLVRASREVNWWPATLAFIVVGVAYSLVADSLTVGPRWALAAVGVVVVVGAGVLRWRGLIHAGRWFAMGGLVVMTAALTISAAYLLQGLINHTVDPIDLLKGGVVLWASNIIAFALWYWEVDGGGPAHRRASGCGSTDFLFPQMALDEHRRPASWTPEYIDYVFLAFNTNTAFSPTDTMVMARRAKLAMMYQSLLSLVSVVVVVARAINSL